MEGQPQIPTATYRLQLNRNFTFRDATKLVPYLSSLGISHCYASPYLRARPGSTHGYDIIDHNALNPEIGTPEEYEQFVAELHGHGMGQILDIVPNHMGVMGSDNAWWLDVLENGEASDYADFFDIDWNPIKSELQGKVLIPILAEQYGSELEKGALKLALDPERGEFSISYHEHRFPVDPREYPRILGFRSDAVPEKLHAANEQLLELQSVATAFGHLPERRGLSPEQKAERNREKEIQKRRFATLLGSSSVVKDLLAENVKAFNGTPNDPHSFDALHELIKAQAYRLAQWRAAADDINYRRFFDINDLAALCMENDDVFAHTHRFIADLVAQGKVNGLRVDHPDGLYDPAKYFRQLQDRLAQALAGQNKHVYTIAEKILSGKERLRKGWPVDGTTGYEFANLTNGLFVDQRSQEKMQRLYRSFSGESIDYGDLVYACKKLILKVGLASELTVLATLLSRIALSDRHTCDFTLNSLRGALSEVIASFPVYRTYVTDREVSPDDRRYIEQAVAAGRRRSNAADLSVFDFVRKVLLLEVDAGATERYRRAVVRFAMKFQQVTAAVMAKGAEDTAFYRYYPLASLNEVGGTPNKFGTSVEEFHRANKERLESWPYAMLSSSTHDSKRSEDVRARINAISEISATWRLSLKRWRNWNRTKKRSLEGEPAPSRNDEYLLYQTLIGTWPDEELDEAGWRTYSERIEQYMLKAVREAKEYTSWANSNVEYEAALSAFVRALLQSGNGNQFRADLREFQQRISNIGVFNSLSECLLKMTSPGVPDIYQGSELFQFNLVDPDNRRPVDYMNRIQLLQNIQIQESPCASETQGTNPRATDAGPWRVRDRDRLKLHLTWKTLTLRRDHAALFLEGSYVPLEVRGAKSEHLVAFARLHEGRTALTIVPRLCGRLLGDNYTTVCDGSLWEDTQVEVDGAWAKSYVDVLTGQPLSVGRDPANEKSRGTLPVAHLLRNFPVALLLDEPARS
jgi:(1->4)-alpha-D-glucan 1-alpha-D-glucosylmutase